jgi:hypothetical protein
MFTLRPPDSPFATRAARRRVARGHAACLTAGLAVGRLSHLGNLEQILQGERLVWLPVG